MPTLSEMDVSGNRRGTSALYGLPSAIQNKPVKSLFFSAEEGKDDREVIPKLFVPDDPQEVFMRNSKHSRIGYAYYRGERESEGSSRMGEAPSGSLWISFR